MSKEDHIRKRAHALWVMRGCRQGHDLYDWFQAEREFELLETKEHFQERLEKGNITPEEHLLRFDNCFTSSPYVSPNWNPPTLVEGCGLLSNAHAWDKWWNSWKTYHASYDPEYVYKYKN